MAENKEILRHLVAASVTRPVTTVSILVILTVFWAIGIGFLKYDTDVSNVLPEHLPEKVLYDQLGVLFPSKEMVVVGIEGEDLLSRQNIARLDRITNRIESISEIDSVLSPTNIRLVEAQNDGIRVHRAADPLPATDEQASTLRQRLKDQPLVMDTLLPQNGKAALMLAFVKTNAKGVSAAANIIALANDPKRNEGFTLHVAGRPASAYWSKKVMGQDMGVLTTTALVVIVVLLLVTFRSLHGVLLPVAIVVGSVLWTLGFMGYVGIAFSHTIEVLPILLLAIGVADAVHVLRAYHSQNDSSKTPQERVLETMRDLSRPIVLTSLTTMAGFLALNTSGITSLMILGGTTAFGILVAMLFSLTLLPAVLVLIKPKAARRDNTRFATMENLAVVCARVQVHHPVLVLLFVGAGILVAAAGMLRIKAEFSTVSNFDVHHSFRLANEMINRYVGATNLSVIVTGDGADAIKDPILLHRMDAMEAWLKKQTAVRSVQSITGYLKQMHRVLHNNDDYRLPSENEVEVVKTDAGAESISVPGRDLIAEYLLLYEMGGAPDQFANLVTDDYSRARVNVLLNSDRSTIIADLNKALLRYMDDTGRVLNVQFSGMAQVLYAVNRLVISGQLWSIATSLLLVFCVTAFVFKSPVLGAFCVAPLGFALMANFGFMGLAGIRLNIETMATSSVAVGVGVDYAIHFIHRIRDLCVGGMNYAAAAVKAMRSSGVAIVVNALTVAGGFSVLMLSGFKGVQYLGLLIALTMLASAFAALTLLPALFVLFKPKALAR